MKFPALPSFLALLFFSLPVCAATRHALPGNALQSLVDQLAAGDTLYLAGGTYALDTSLFLLNLHGAQERPVVVCNEPGQVPVLRYDSLFSVFVHVDSGGAAQNVITLGGCSYVEIAGLEITRGRSGIETHYGDNDHIAIRDCHIHDVGNVGIRIASDLETYFRCVHNHIHHTGVHGEGFYVGNNPSDSTHHANPAHCEFINNWIHHTANIPSPDNQGDGIELKSGCRNMIVRNNVIHDTKYPCLTLWGTSGGNLIDNNQVFDNLLFNSRDAVLQVTGETDVFNNIILNSVDTARKGLSIEENTSSGTSLRLVRVFNNTIINAYASISSNLNAPDSCVFANNAVYNVKRASVRFTDRIDSAAYGSFSHNMVYGTPWLIGDTIPGFIRSTQALQAFADANAFNYYPAPNSELKGGGINLASLNLMAAQDFNGRQRGIAWDIGAYQYDANTPSNPGWVLKDWGGGFMDTLLTGPVALEEFFVSFDREEPLGISASPNPFHSGTGILISGMTAARLYNPMAGVFLGIYNSRGQLVRNLTPALFQSSGKSIRWDADALPPDRYFVRLTAGNKSISQIITLL